MIPMHSNRRHGSRLPRPNQEGMAMCVRGALRPAKRESEQARTEQDKSCNGYCEKTEGGDLITHAKS
jgi:hypothetical protein